MNGRAVLVVIAVTAALVSAASTGGFSVSEADRGVDVAVVDDDRAFLGVETYDRAHKGGSPTWVTLVRVTNRLGESFHSVDISVDGTGGPPPVLQHHRRPAGLAAGESDTVRARINCDNGRENPRTESWEVRIRASGESASVALSRTVSITCKRSTPTPQPTSTDGSAASTPASSPSGE
jgi:hypothetical protein